MVAVAHKFGPSKIKKTKDRNGVLVGSQLKNCALWRSFLILIVSCSHGFLDVESWIYFLARIEDVVWIEKGFGLFEEFEHFL